MNNCPNCGVEIEEGIKFCKQCGMPVHIAEEEASTLRLPPNTAPARDSAQPTRPVSPGPATPPHYNPPPAYYQPPEPVQYQPPAQYDPPAQAPPTYNKISLGDWLSGGWQVYKENGLLMSLASFLAAIISFCTLGVLAGPLLMGLYRMAFKTMRGERPELGDLFRWEGRFLQAFLAFLIAAAIHGGLTGAGNNSALFVILNFVVTPLLTMLLGLALPLIMERKMDIAAAINEVGRLIFSRDALMWWVVGLVFSTIAAGGTIACLVGVFITLPWIISSSAVAYRDVFGFDDPNRTLH
ncbi:MAG: zinc-ribbon domain-containing protein [Blastocatellia bacterium]|nr:zinc-ribbon domain-containing protein [Blastocatellia bacterium]